MAKYVKLKDVMKTIADPLKACTHEGCSNCEFVEHDDCCEILYLMSMLPSKEIVNTLDHLELIKWCKMALDGWNDVIINTVTEEGLRLNKFGAEQLRNDLYEVCNTLRTLETSPENEES